MRAEDWTPQALEAISSDAIQAGFDELQRYIRSTPANAGGWQEKEAAENLSDEIDDPRFVGLDRVERTLTKRHG